jgi:hypothetical protein
MGAVMTFVVFWVILCVGTAVVIWAYHCGCLFSHWLHDEVQVWTTNGREWRKRR